MVDDIEIWESWPSDASVRSPVLSHPSDGGRRIAITPYWHENHVCEELRIREMDQALDWESVLHAVTVQEGFEVTKMFDVLMKHDITFRRLVACRCQWMFELGCNCAEMT